MVPAQVAHRPNAPRRDDKPGGRRGTPSDDLWPASSSEFKHLTARRGGEHTTEIAGQVRVPRLGKAPHPPLVAAVRQIEYRVMFHVELRCHVEVVGAVDDRTSLHRQHHGKFCKPLQP